MDPTKDDLNKVELIGTVVSKPDVKYSRNTVAIATVTLNVYDKDASLYTGGASDIEIKFFGLEAELIETKLKEGDRIMVEAVIRTNRRTAQISGYQYTETTIYGKKYKPIDDEVKAEQTDFFGQAADL